jgi:DnaJ-class molecular chaperone
MEVGRFVNPPATASAGETNFFSAKTTRKLHRAQCWECYGTGKVSIYPLVAIPCYACKGKGYIMELHLRFGVS